jgi:hypothetical protein
LTGVSDGSGQGVLDRGVGSGGPGSGAQDAAGVIQAELAAGLGHGQLDRVGGGERRVDLNCGP